MPNSPYSERLNRAVDHIETQLANPLSLETIAAVACFSPFHFHRLFRIHTGETLNNFIKRRRLERAIGLMTQPGWDARQQESLTEIALACGFNSSTDFSRSFKQHFGIPPSMFDVADFRDQGRDSWRDRIADTRARQQLDGLAPGENPDGFTADLCLLPARTVAYLRVADSYREGAVPATAQRIVAWAEERNLADGQWLGYTWDDPEVVAPEKCRYDIGLEVSPETSLSDGAVSRIQFPAMTVAEVKVVGGIDLEMRALDWLFTTWLPGSGRIPAHQPCFEAWMGLPFAHGLEHFELRLQLPLERI